jgi:hypothetical protein
MVSSRCFFLLITLASSAVADSYNWKKCFCVDDEIFGYSINSTWLRDGIEKPLWWGQHGHLALDRRTCQDMFGTQCDSHSCWNVPNAYCFKSITDAAEPYYDIPCSYASGLKGGKICGSRKIIKYDGKKIYVPDKKKKNMNVNTKTVDCAAECKGAWPNRNMKPACSYKYVNKKSQHDGEDVPTGYHMKKNGKLEIWYNPWGKGSMCTEVDYPYF